LFVADHPTEYPRRNGWLRRILVLEMEAIQAGIWRIY